MDRGHLQAAVDAGLPPIIAIKFGRGELLERFIKADAIRIASNNFETIKTVVEFVEKRIQRMDDVNHEPNKGMLSAIRELEQANKTGAVLAALCLMIWQEGLLVDTPRHRRNKNLNSKFSPWESKLPLRQERPDAWRRRLVCQHPDEAKALEGLLEAASEKPVPRSPRRILRDQRDTKRPNRRPSRE